MNPKIKFLKKHLLLISLIFTTNELHAVSSYCKVDSFGSYLVFKTTVIKSENGQLKTFFRHELKSDEEASDFAGASEGDSHGFRMFLHHTNDENKKLPECIINSNIKCENGYIPSWTEKNNISSKKENIILTWGYHSVDNTKIGKKFFFCRFKYRIYSTIDENGELEVLLREGATVIDDSEGYQKKIAHQREARQREARQREARQREARQREARQREARQREARQREARQREARQREARQREARQRAENPIVITFHVYRRDNSPFSPSCYAISDGTASSREIIKEYNSSKNHVYIGKHQYIDKVGNITRNAGCPLYNVIR